MSVILEIFNYFGGGALIVIGLVAWLGSVWVNRIRDKDKTEFKKELEQYKSQLELAKLVVSRYSGYQFVFYNKLWVSLCDLKFAGDKLWNELSAENLLNFAVMLNEAKIELLKNVLLVEDEHYIKLKQLIDKFGNYQIGKIKLMKLRKSDVDILQYLEEFRIVRENESTKLEYEELILIIKDYFRKQIKHGL